MKVLTHGKSLVGALLAGAMFFAATGPAHALKFVFNDIGGVKGTPAAAGFRAAARYWESIITTDVTIKVDIGFQYLGRGVLGQARSSFTTDTVANVRANTLAGASDSLVDQSVRSLGFTPLVNDGLQFVKPGYYDPVAKTGALLYRPTLDSDGSTDNKVLGLTTANAKALGYSGDSQEADALIVFSSRYAFDFNPKNGIDGYDFIGIAIHEIGHALGFHSGVDDYDYIGCLTGPGCSDYLQYPTNNEWWGLALDQFRYSRGSDFNRTTRFGTQLNWLPGEEAYFSIDGGLTSFNGNSSFSTGRYNGDGHQASHWKAPVTPGEPGQAVLCERFIGAMNPYLCRGELVNVTANDVAAFDAIGWNIVKGAQGNDYSIDTRGIAGIVGVPEAQTWAMLVIGFGMIGGTIRRRQLRANGEITA
jgi:hypothetical protein